MPDPTMTETMTEICGDEATRGALLQMFVERQHPELIPEFAEFVAELDAELDDFDDDDDDEDD